VRRSTAVSRHSCLPDPAPVERRSGVDRRSGRGRRCADPWQLIGRPGFDLRRGIERRSGGDRRRSEPREPQGGGRRWSEIVTPCQIIEGFDGQELQYIPIRRGDCPAGRLEWHAGAARLEQPEPRLRAGSAV